MRPVRTFLAYTFLLIGCCGLLLSQSALTSLRGTVTDPSGALIPGSQITIENQINGFKAVQLSNGSGEYQFQQIVPGTYLITATNAGFGDQSKQANLLVNQPATINFTLTVQASTTTVDVSSEAQTLNTADASIGNSYNNAMIEALPMEGRNVPDLLSLQPGVLYLGRNIDKDSDSRSGAVAGARSDQTNVTLDGLDDNDQENGYAFTGILRSTLDSVEEFRVTTTGSNADAGRSSGGQVSMVTKSGTNMFHGSLYEYYRPSNTVANDWFNKQAQLASDEPNIPGKLIRNTFGASTGGPILKDKLFFFGNYEGQRTAENQQVTRTTPTASFKAGNVVYPSNGQNVTLNSAQIASMDPSCAANGTCPWGPGVDPNILAVFNQYPTANGSAQGDGVNLGSYTFSSPNPGSLNTSIAKLDWTPTEKQRLFVRGNLQKDRRSAVIQFPGQGPSSLTEDNSKGVSAGDTYSVSSNLVNDLRYGYVRQGYSIRGLGQVDYVTLRFMDQPVPNANTNPTSIVFVPVHNVIDNVTWVKGKHTFSGGANWRLVNNISDTNANSYNSASTNEDWLANSGAIAGQTASTGVQQSLDPGGFGFPAVDSGSFIAYNDAIGLVTGLVPQATGQYNYQVSPNGATGALLDDGRYIQRHFHNVEFEYFLQDSWRVKPNLTFTFGLRHTILQTPYETTGQQIAPTIDTHAWFKERGAAAAAGQVYEPDLSFSPSGQARGGKPYWPMNWGNVAPRLAVAYAPTAKISIRAGAGIYYDHYGQGITNSFNSLGSFGSQTTLQNPANSFTVDDTPRFTGLNSLPQPLPGAGANSSVTYPYTPPELGGINWGIDSKIKTPYSEAFDFSIQREVGKGFTFETAYVGRFGRHLLQQLDLAEPVNLVDPASGMDYFTAGTMLSKVVDQNATAAGYNSNAQVAPIPYFEDLFPDAAGSAVGGVGTPGASATQNIYSLLWSQNRGNETGALITLDESCYPGCGGQLNRYWHKQFTSLYAWSSIGTSSYNAAQMILRHAMSHGYQMDVSYTLSKSIDMGSDTERTGELNAAGSFSEIINSWNPKLNRGVSDFDTRNLITADGVYMLPFGRGQHFLGGANRITNALIGGWQYSGLGRWSSGLPFSVIEAEWTTNWQIQSAMVTTAYVPLKKHLLSTGAPEAFADPDSINNGYITGSPLRLPYPGEAGERNNFRGDGYFDIDSGLAKTWSITERQSVKFAWEVFNVTNSVRFDTNPVRTQGGLSVEIGSPSLGVYSSTLSIPRVMQFSLRYSF